MTHTKEPPEFPGRFMMASPKNQVFISPLP